MLFHFTIRPYKQINSSGFSRSYPERQIKLIKIRFLKLKFYQNIRLHPFAANICQFKVNNRNTKKGVKI